ncbi:MAG: hypothetical protein KF712_15030 [Akkermansiaceae bacterium]|nr:hypothetical protein [Akkermansiaceae bacterium]
MMRKPHLPFLPLIALLSMPLHGEEIQGAEAVLRRLKDPTAQDQPKDAGEILKARLESYRTGAAAMPPEKAAAEWIQLLESYLTLPQQSRMALNSTFSRFSAETIIEALPPAQAWDALAAELQKRSAAGKSRTSALQGLLGAMLTADPAGRLPALARLKDNISADARLEDYQRRQIDGYLDNLETLLSPPGGPAADPVTKLSKQLDEQAAQRFSGYGTVIPKLPETAAAREVLMRILKTDTVLRFEDEETKGFFIRIAREQLESLPEPPWNLIRSLGDAELFETAAKLRPEAAKAMAESDEVLPMLLKHYLRQGREAEAMAIIKNPKLSKRVSYHPYVRRIDGAIRSSDSDENAERLLLKLEIQALRDDPNLPYWQSVRSSAQKYGQSAAFQKSVEAALADPRLISPEARQDLENIHLTHLLNDGKVDEGVKLLEELLANAEKPAGAPAGQTSDGDQLTAPPDTSSRNAQLLTRAIRLGRLLDRPELLDRSLQAYSKLLPTLSHLPLVDDVIWTSYIERNLGASLEKGLSDHVVRLAASKDNGYGGRNFDSPLAQLARLYEKLGRHGDVIRLLDEAPFWSGPDLAELEIGSNELMLAAAKSMNATGRGEKALAIIRHLIRSNPGHDEGYLLLSQLNPPDQMAFLEEIAAANRFEERPLIWQARLLLSQGKMDEAEATVKKAIAIDPSDGEQGKGDRMRAYEVLADILEKKGDAEQTKFFRNVVAAIRLSETADDWWAADMTQKAITIYEQSLRSFADAYCIQSRLALRYASEDNMEKATQHYQRAFELMPDSFGRIESHCFGCEGAFTGKVAQSIAEKVFTELAEKPDAKPQVFYLLGYLRESQDRTAEAKEFFQKAVKMDPDYVNAWSKLGELSDKVALSPAEKDEIAFNLFRLKSEPQNLASAGDLRRIWTALLELERSKPAFPKDLYPLPAAKERLGKGESESFRSHFRSTEDHPRTILARHPLIQGVTNLIDASVSYN